jgi:virginiamycin A acetyltransferase
VPPYAIVGGNPAKVIRQRFDDLAIANLLKIAWWNWDMEKITRNLDRIVSADITALQNCT